MSTTACNPKLTRQRNSYAAQCRDCGRLCPPDSGRLYEKENGYWSIRCDKCLSEAESAANLSEAESAANPKSRLEQRKAAWKEFRKPISNRDADGYSDHPPWEHFLWIWKKCAGFDADFRQRMAAYREEFKSTAATRAEARAETKRKWEEGAEERQRKWRAEYEERAGKKVDWNEDWETRQEREYQEWQRDHVTEYIRFRLWCVDNHKTADRDSWFLWKDPDLRSIWENLQSLIREQNGASSVDCLKAMGLTPPVTIDQVKAAFRTKSKEAHPDHGGSDEAFIALRANYEKALSYAEEMVRT